MSRPWIGLVMMALLTLAFAILYSLVELCLDYRKVVELFGVLYRAQHYYGNVYGYHLVMIALFAILAFALCSDAYSFLANLILGLTVEDIVATMLCGHSICDSMVYYALNVKAEIPFIHIAAIIIASILYILHLKVKKRVKPRV